LKPELYNGTARTIGSISTPLTGPGRRGHQRIYSDVGAPQPNNAGKTASMSNVTSFDMVPFQSGPTLRILSCAKLTTTQRLPAMPSTFGAMRRCAVTKTQLSQANIRIRVVACLQKGLIEYPDRVGASRLVRLRPVGRRSATGPRRDPFPPEGPARRRWYDGARVCRTASGDRRGENVYKGYGIGLVPKLRHPRVSAGHVGNAAGTVDLAELERVGRPDWLAARSPFGDDLRQAAQMMEGLPIDMDAARPLCPRAVPRITDIPASLKVQKS
jgi:hypothetical protein